MCIFINDYEDSSKTLATRVQKFIEDAITWANLQEEHEKLKKEQNERYYGSYVNYSTDNLLVTQFKGVYEIRFPWLKIPIQICSSTNPDVFFDNIDIRCTCLCWWEQTLCISEDAKFELENLAIRINHRRNNKQYIERVLKYYNKGIDLIMPHFEISKIPTRNFSFFESDRISHQVT